jgi:hypothetical protein
LVVVVEDEEELEVLLVGRPAVIVMTGTLKTTRIGCVRFLSVRLASMRSGHAVLLHSSYHVSSFST